MKVLIAATDRDFLKSYKKLFTLEGFEVSTAFDGLQVMAWLKEKKYNLVILDQGLPRVGADRLAGLIRETKIPLLMLLGEENNTSPEVGRNNGEESLCHPFFPEELFEKVRGLLEAREEEGKEAE